MTATVRAAVFAATALGAGCASLAGDPLTELHPVVWLADAEVELLTCRFTTQDPIGVSLDADASEEETQALDRALAAWERAGLGVRFLRVPRDGAQIHVVFAAGPLARADGSSGAGRARADCLLTLGPEGQAAGVQMVVARVEIAREIGPNWKGKMQPLTPDERMGTLIHELGHALGYQGHVRRGEDAMRGTPESIRRMGRAVAGGAAVQSGALQALYALPTGTRLQAVPVDRWQTHNVDRMARVAAAEGLAGPFLRAGDAAARIFWRGAGDKEYGFLVPEIEEVARDPQAALALPEARTRAVLPRSRDLAP